MHLVVLLVAVKRATDGSFPLTHRERPRRVPGPTFALVGAFRRRG
jgi:hypothetical protein